MLCLTLPVIQRNLRMVEINKYYYYYYYYTAVFSVVTQRSWGGALRDNPKNGCVAD